MRRNKDESNSITAKITSINHLYQFINDGYEIERTEYHFEPGLSNVTLTLVKNGTKIIADANAIDEYTLNLVPLYDPNKKSMRMLWVPDTDIYWKFEMTLSTLILNLVETKTSSPIFTTQLPSQAVYFELIKWISRGKGKKYRGKKLSAMFSSVCIVNSKNGKIASEIYEKNLLDLQQIHILLDMAKKLDNSISISFVILNQNLKNTATTFDDVLIGIIVYDLKHRKTIAINFLSFTSYLRQYEFNINEGLYDIAKKLFDDTIHFNLELKSFLPLPLDSPLFTIIPWIMYSNLSDIKVSTELQHKNYAITIPEFFTFGYSEFLVSQKTFDFSYFAHNKKGHATCILHFNDYYGKKIKYIMRFDQSPKEPLVHIDFSFYEDSEKKLISHHPLDLESVYYFNPELFIGMMSAGLFDTHFNTLLDKGLKGIQNLIKNNPAFSFPLIFIWKIETWVSWLNDNKIGYQILKKLFYLIPLDENEKQFLPTMIKETQLGDYSLIRKNENGEESLNIYGYMVLVRFLRNQTKLSLPN